MKELKKIKEQATHIVTGSSNDFTVTNHVHLDNDVWSITVKSNNTNKLYKFKDDGFEFYDFESEKS